MSIQFIMNVLFSIILAINAFERAKAAGFDGLPLAPVIAASVVFTDLLLMEEEDDRQNFREGQQF